MPVARKLVGGPKGGDLTDLFDYGKAESVMPGMLFSLVEAGKHPLGIQRCGQTRIADAKPAGFQRNVDVALRDIVVAGVTEQVVEQDIDQFGACTNGGG